MTSPAPTAFQDAGAFILSDHPLYLKQKIVLSGAADRAIEEHHLGASTSELFDEQHLVSIPSRKPVRRMYINAVDFASCYNVSQPLQGWARQGRSAATFVDKGVVRVDRRLVAYSPLAQSRYLACNGVAACLPVT